MLGKGELKISIDSKFFFVWGELSILRCQCFGSEHKPGGPMWPPKENENLDCLASFIFFHHNSDPETRHGYRHDSQPLIGWVDS